MRYTFSANGTYYIDLAKDLSIQERKLHRGKQLFTVYGGYVKDVDGSTVHINTAPNTWPVKRAINRSFNLWRKMIARTLADMQGAGTGSYSDFKVYLNKEHASSHDGASPAILKECVDAEGLPLWGGIAPEWAYSTLTSEDPDGAGGGAPDQYQLHIVGPHAGSDPNWTSIGTLESWVNSRALPSFNHPNLPPQFPNDPLNNLFDAGDVQDDRLNVLSEENDDAPYDEDKMFGNAQLANVTPGGSNNLQRMSSSQTSTANPITSVMGFTAVCGLLQVVVTGSGTEMELVIDVESKGEKF